MNNSINNGMKLEYYYNFTPEHGKVRNNLVYTSLISRDKKTFVKWFHNDTEYHQGKNEVIESSLMQEKWNREVKFITLMTKNYPELIPEVLDVDFNNQKIFFKIDGVDFWQKHYDCKCSYDKIVSNWREQKLNILSAHKKLQFYKISLHPSSYFVVDKKLKSINYFFCYNFNEGPVRFEDFRTHISKNRQEKLEKQFKDQKIWWNTEISLKKLQLMALDSFKSNYPVDFIEAAKKIYA